MAPRPEEILKAAREKKKLTQSDIAYKLGITLRQYHKYESGKFPKYKSEVIQKLDTILGTNLFESIYEQKVPQEVRVKGDIEGILRNHEEKILRLEAYVEVYETELAGILSESKNDFPKKIDELRNRVQAAVNRRFDELSKRQGTSS